MTAAAQARCNDADGIACSDPPLLETLCERQEVLAAIGALELGEGAERQAQPIGPAAKLSVDDRTAAVTAALERGIVRLDTETVRHDRP